MLLCYDNSINKRMVDMTRILVVNDFLKVHYVQKTASGGVRDIYFDTKEGKTFKQFLGKALQEQQNNGNRVEKFDLDLKYAYPLIPKIVRSNPRFPENNSYKPVTQTEFKPYEESLYEYIKETDPDIIIPTGTTAVRVLFKTGSISKSRGLPIKMMLDGDTKKRWFLPMFSMSYYLTKPSREPLVLSDFRLLADFIANGESAFVAKPVQYVTVLDFEMAKKVLKTAAIKGVSPELAPAFDYESNVLSAEAKTAKPLSISISWKERTGYTIPLAHRSAPWTKEQLNVLYTLIVEMLSSDNYKVAHNGGFDIKLTKIDIDKNLYTRHILDTKIGYFITTSQAQEVSFGLKELAYQFTDMGGYEHPLDEYKKWFLLQKVRKNTFVGKYFSYKNGEYELSDDDYLSWLTDENKSYALMIAEELYQEFDGKITSVRNSNDSSTFNYEWIPLDILCVYASGDVDAAYRINHKLYTTLIAPNPDWVDLYTRHYPEIQEVVSNLEAEGTQVDRKRLEEIGVFYSQQIEKILSDLKKLPLIQKVHEYKEALYEKGLEEKPKPKSERNEELYKLYTKYRKPEDREFNPGSTSDTKMVLFSLTGYTLPAEDDYITAAAKTAIKTKQKKREDLTVEDYSTGAKTMEYILKNYPDFKEAKMISNYKKYIKLNSSFVSGILSKLDENDKVHGSYNLTGTETTRMSSANPNMQQLPRYVADPEDITYNYQVKSALIPYKEYNHDTLVLADFSSQEVHLAAVLAHDDNMIEDFINGEDVHTTTASMVYHVKKEDVTPELRTKAKAVTYGLLYGETPESFAPKQHDPEMTLEESKELFDSYFSSKPKIKQLIEDAKTFVEKNGYAVIPGSGFRRKLQEVNSSMYSERSKALRQSLNSQIQGGASYITQVALINLDKAIRKFGLNAKIFITVHDSIGVSTEKKLVPTVVKVMKYVMENLPMDYLKIEHNGKNIQFKMETEIGVTDTYQHEYDFNEDDFKNAVSTKAYVNYYGKLNDLKNRLKHHIMSDEDYEEEKAYVISHKNDILSGKSVDTLK